jgi:hypothetical protein
LLELGDLCAIEVNADDVKSGRHHFHRQGQTYVAEADNGSRRFAIL